jgi:hypothetical protein
LPAVSNIAATDFTIAYEQVCQTVAFQFVAIRTNHGIQWNICNVNSDSNHFAIHCLCQADCRITSIHPLSGPFAPQGEEIVKQFSVVLRFQKPLTS